MPRKRTSRPWIAGARELCRARSTRWTMRHNARLPYIRRRGEHHGVTTEVGQHRALRRPTADPTATPTTPPSPEPTGVPRARRRPCPRRSRRPADAVPDGHVPELGDARGLRAELLVLRSYSRPSTGPHETLHNEHMEKDFNPAEPDQWPRVRPRVQVRRDGRRRPEGWRRYL